MELLMTFIREIWWKRGSKSQFGIDKGTNEKLKHRDGK